jgi:serine/threonine protein kinase
MDMYMVGKVVGVGSYGKVRAAWHRLTGSKVAIKTYDKSKLKDPAHWKRVHSEIKIMEQVSHPRIARMYEAVETPKRMHLIMECLDGGNLCSYVKAKRRLSEDESRRIFFQILQSIDHLHMLGVTHRDIKLENVLFANANDIKLIDFGFSTVCQPGKRLKVFCGTPSYMAPEIVRRTEYEGKPVDMWSLGILLYALLCGCFPFRAKSYPDLYRRIARGTFAIPEELSASVKDLLTQLLTVDVAQRINASAAMRHSWLQVQLATSPDINKLRQDTPILISDKPSDDIDEQTLGELDKFGLGKDEVIRLVLTKTHSSIATFYYLLLDVNIQKRRQMMAKRGTSASAKTRSGSSSSSSNPNGNGSGNGNSSSSGNGNGHTSYANSKGETYLLQQQHSQGSGGGGGGGSGNAGGSGVNLLRPKSASAGRPSNSGQQRPLSAFASRR